ncbi:MAG: RHS repeat domain-containing protein [Bacteroidota bacterium]
MKPINYILTILLLLGGIHLYAQPVNTLIQDVVLPAPNAAALGKYSDIPVSHFTGVTSISVPLYAVQEGPLGLPISLNYHASGLKVAETASWVGMGWSLNAGGMITRTVLGIPDERTFGFANYGYRLKEREESYVDPVQFMQDVATGLLDSEPDIFSFNFLGNAGKFYIDDRKTVHLIPEQDVRIDVNWGREKISGFVVTTPNGVRYYFGNFPRKDNDPGIEKSISSSANPDDPNAENISSWYLLRAESPDSIHQINLIYEEEAYSYNYLGSCSFSHLQCYSSLGSSSGGQNYDCAGLADLELRKNLQRNNVTGKRLSKITTTSGLVEVNFKKGSLRQDLDTHGLSGAFSAYTLGEIEIKEQADCKEWNFSYTYSQPFPGTIPNARSEGKRLILTQLSEQSCDGATKIPPYKFSYKGEQNGLYTLPHRLTKAIDHWGYYNGKISNESSNFLNIPKTTLKLLTGREFSHGENDRDTHAEWVDIGILEKITYPTGGLNEFIYEPHSYFGQESDVNLEEIQTLFSCGTNSSACCDTYIRCCTSNTTYTHSFDSDEEIDSTRITFDLKVPPHVVAELKDQFPLEWEYCYGDEGYETIENANSTCASFGEFKIKVIISEASSNVKVGELEYNLDLQTGTQTCLTQTHLLRDFEVNKNLKPNTSYRFELSVPQGIGEAFLFTQFTEEKMVNKFVGGVRVKEVKTKLSESQSGYERVKKYSYTEDGSSQSSGRLFFDPQYGYFFEAFNDGSDYVLDIFFQEQSIVPLGAFDGVHIGYERVVESEDGNGESVHTFYIEKPLLATNLIPNPPQLATVINGNLKNVSHYKAGASNEVGSTYSEYNAGYSDMEGYIFKLSRFPNSCQDFYIGVGGGIQVKFPDFYIRDFYNPRTSPLLIKKQVSTLDNVQTVAEYSYDGAKRHYFPTKIATTQSNGRISEQRFKYPPDYADGLNFGNGSNINIDALKDQYLISTPIEVQTWEGSTSSKLGMTGGQIQVFKNFGNSSKPILKPYKTFVFESNEPVDKKEIKDAEDNPSKPYQFLRPEVIAKDYYKERAYSIYDAQYASLVEQSLTNGTPISYLWDFRGNRPIAQVVGKTYDQIKSTATTQLRSKFKDALVTTYTFEGRLRVSSITQPDGVKTQYRYDGLDRLIETQDDDGKLLQRIKYNIPNP